MSPRRSFTLSHLLATLKFAFKAYTSGSLPRYCGPYHDQFSTALCEFSGSKSAVPVSSGTSAVFVMLQTLKKLKKRFIAIPRFTDPGVLHCCQILGLQFRIIPSSQRSHPFDAEDLAAFLLKYPETDSLLYTHIGGYLSSHIPKLLDMCARKNILVLEDASQGFGYKNDSFTIGQFGELTAISMMGSKLLTSGTQGGAVLVNNDELFAEVKLHADRGKRILPSNRRDYVRTALNFNLCEFACCLGIVSLKKVPSIIKKRQKIVRQIAISCREFKKFQIVAEETSAYWFLIGIVLDYSIVNHLEDSNIIEYPYLGDVYTYEGLVELYEINEKTDELGIFVIRFHESMSGSDVRNTIVELERIEKGLK